MNESRLDQEMKAYEAFHSTVKSAREAERLFIAAGIEVPAPLLRLFGTIEAGGESETDTRRKIPDIRKPPAPAEAKDDWLWVKASDLATTNLALSVLKAASKPLPPNEIYQLAKAYRPGLNHISVYNIGPRLDGTLLNRDVRGWSLIDPSKVPTIHGEYAWGPEDVFHAIEVAAYRRMLIHHLISTSTDGLMVMQVVRELQQLRKHKYSVTKELVQDDLEALENHGLVKRIGNSRKWVTRKSAEQ